MSSRNYLYRQIFFRGRHVWRSYTRTAAAVGAESWLDLTYALSLPVKQATNYSSLHLAVLCCCLHFPPAVPCLHLVFFISFPQVFFGLPFVYGPVALTVILVLQCCRRFFSKCAQASFIFFFLARTVLAPDQWSEWRWTDTFSGYGSVEFSDRA